MLKDANLIPRYVTISLAPYPPPPLRNDFSKKYRTLNLKVVISVDFQKQSKRQFYGNVQQLRLHFGYFDNIFEEWKYIEISVRQVDILYFSVT